MPRDDAVDGIFQAVRFRLGQEADVAEVHAQQGRPGGPGELGGAQQRAVSADHDHDLRPLGGVRAGRHLLHAGESMSIASGTRTRTLTPAAMSRWTTSRALRSESLRPVCATTRAVRLLFVRFTAPIVV